MRLVIWCMAARLEASSRRQTSELRATTQGVPTSDNARGVDGWSACQRNVGPNLVLELCTRLGFCLERGVSLLLSKKVLVSKKYRHFKWVEVLNFVQ